MLCRFGQYVVRLVAVAISVGGMLITALMLGIVSGQLPAHARVSLHGCTGSCMEQGIASLKVRGAQRQGPRCLCNAACAAIAHPQL